MTHDEILAVVTAHRDGKTVEGRAKDSKLPWRDVEDSPSWDFQDAEFRVKPDPPKPREWVLEFTDDGEFKGIIEYPQHASDMRNHYSYVRVREVMPE